MPSDAGNLNRYSAKRIKNIKFWVAACRWCLFLIQSETTRGFPQVSAHSNCAAFFRCCSSWCSLQSSAQVSACWQISTIIAFLLQDSPETRYLCLWSFLGKICNQSLHIASCPTDYPLHGEEKILLTFFLTEIPKMTVTQRSKTGHWGLKQKNHSGQV